MKWKCKNGEIVDISEMSDSHLLNTINCILDRRVTTGAERFEFMLSDAFDRKLIKLYQVLKYIRTHSEILQEEDRNYLDEIVYGIRHEDAGIDSNKGETMMTKEQEGNLDS